MGGDGPAKRLRLRLLLWRSCSCRPLLLEEQGEVLRFVSLVSDSCGSPAESMRSGRALICYFAPRLGVSIPGFPICLSAFSQSYLAIVATVCLFNTACCKSTTLIITEPDVNNNGRNFVFNYTLAKAVVEYAAAVSYSTPLHFSILCHIY